MLRKFLFPLALASAAAILSQPAGAQGYPTRPIRFVVPFAAGGGSDVVARIIAHDLSQSLGQQVIVDNRAGAQGVLGATIVAQAPPDGYTIMLSHVGTIGMNPWLYKNIYDPNKQFTHIAQVTSQPTVVVVSPTLPAQSLKDLMALAKAKPGALTFASGSTIGQLTGELWLLISGTKMLHVPYKGGSQAIRDVVTGQVDVIFGSLPSSLPMVKAGRVKLIAVAGPKRLPAVPDVPTAKEAGFPQFDVDVWYGIAGPPRMPREVVNKLNVEIAKVVNSPGAREKLEAQGLEAKTSSSAEITAFVREEHQRWGKVVKAAGVTPVDQ